MQHTGPDVHNFYGAAVNLKSRLWKEVAKHLPWLPHMTACLTGQLKKDPSFHSEFPKNEMVQVSFCVSWFIA